MCSYNEVNQTHSCANAYTQNKLLKDELGFAGGIMSDWGGVWADTDINGGLDIKFVFIHSAFYG
jgi:beta-glucosidase